MEKNWINQYENAASYYGGHTSLGGRMDLVLAAAAEAMVTVTDSSLFTEQCYAERSIAMASHLSVCLSLCPRRWGTVMT